MSRRASNLGQGHCWFRRLCLPALFVAFALLPSMANAYPLDYWTVYKTVACTNPGHVCTTLTGADAINEVVSVGLPKQLIDWCPADTTNVYCQTNEFQDWRFVWGDGNYSSIYGVSTPTAGMSSSVQTHSTNGLYFNCTNYSTAYYKCTTGTGWNGGSWFLTAYY